MTETYTVLTQEDKSARVWKGLEKKTERNVLNMLTYVWLSELPGSDELLFRYIRKTFDSKVDISTNFADQDVIQVHKTAKKVSTEKHRMIELVRFQKAADDIFFAPFRPIIIACPHYFAFQRSFCRSEMDHLRYQARLRFLLRPENSNRNDTRYYRTFP